MTLDKSQDIPFCHGQHLGQESLECNLWVQNNDPDMNFSYMCIVTLTQEIWPWVKVKVMGYPWVLDYDCLNDYDCVIQIQLTSEKQWAKHDF